MNSIYHSSALLHLRRALFFAIAIVFGIIASRAPASAFQAGDNFNDNSKDGGKWGPDTVFHKGVLNEINQCLEYTCASGTADDDAWRPWILTRFPYTSNWQFQFDVFNGSWPTQAFQVDSIGVLIQNTHPDSDEIFAELYASSLGGPNTTRTGFDTELETPDDNDIEIDSGAIDGATNAAIRISFNAATKVITVEYDVDVTDGYQWVEHATFGIAGSGGANGNTDWGLLDTDQFAISIYGYSAGMTIGSGQMFVDNFGEDGGVPSSGGTVPTPTGSFQFGFPKNNPLLTAIYCLSGNYHGVSPTIYHRNYSLDVAQDESGKLMAMGTIDGIADESGNTELSESIGSVKTVNGEPTVNLKGSFAGTRDGVDTTFSGKATAPIAVVDVGGGTNGFTGSGSYKGKLDGVPFSAKNVPFAVAAPEGATNNMQKDWSLNLDIQKRFVKGKARTYASAQLTLPNGETVSYKERTAKYSARKGFNLSFQRGTNITANPTVIDKKSSLTIKHLTFVQDGANWVPTGGTIKYQFLGQKGKANLMDFEH